MSICIYTVYTLVAVVSVLGQVEVHTAAQLADALRDGQRSIHIGSTITGYEDEQQAFTAGELTSERYSDFPQLPNECVPQPQQCTADAGLVHVSVPTTITGARGVLWDAGFLRRRAIVSEDVTIESMRIQGFVSGTAPYVLWFFFTNNANLVCNNCTIEHDCAGGKADYFMEDVGLEWLSQGAVTLAQDGASAWGTVPMRAQDASAGTTSVQVFKNSTFVCRPEAPPEPSHMVQPDTTVRPGDICQSAANEGRSYRGTQNTTRSGRACQRWDAMQPNAHDRTPERFPAAGLTENYCRNPDDNAEVWCYTLGGPRREACGVPLCDDQAAGSGGGGGGGDDMERRRMIAVVGITSTAVIVAIFAIVTVVCMAFRRLRRERHEHSRVRKAAHSYSIPGQPLVFSDGSSNAYWIRSQSTSADGGRHDGAHFYADLQATPPAGHPGAFPSASGSLPIGVHASGAVHRMASHGSSSSGSHVRRADTAQKAMWTQPAEQVHVWTPPTRGRPEVTTTPPSSGGMWGDTPDASLSRRTTRGTAGAPRDSTTMGTRDASLPSAWTALALTPDSPPGQLLEAQLEWLLYHEDGHLLEYLRLVPHLGLRAGGQGAVAFAQHQNAATRLYALKFFCSDDAFHIEREAAMLPELRALMPPVEVIEQRPEVLAEATARMPWPLRARPLPPVIVTEKGESLDDFVRRSAPDFFTSLQVMVHIAEKLQQLHAAGWTHRDLKPGNAIWLPSQNSWTLIDFGCAARIGEEAPLGFSLYYAPPEVVQAYDSGCKTTLCAAAADVWALGVICWELLTKQRFYGAGARSHAVIAQLCGRDALPTEGPICTDLCRRLGGTRLCGTILAMLSRAPEQRPPVGELLRQWMSVFGEADTA